MVDMLIVSRRYLPLHDGEGERVEPFTGSVEPHVELDLRVLAGGRRLEVVHTLRVAAERLMLVPDGLREVADDEYEPNLSIDVVEEDVGLRISRIADALALLFGRAIRLRRTGPTEFVPESDDDRVFLDGIADPKLLSDDGHVVGVSVLSHSMKVSHANVTFLLDRSSGPRLYHEALQSSSSTGAFRDLWRALESAFQEGRALVPQLMSFPDARAMGFDRVELNGLRTLRGHASHAQSSSGVKEIVTVEHLCRQEVSRLANLVERVIIAKSAWGSSTVGTIPERSIPGFASRASNDPVI